MGHSWFLSSRGTSVIYCPIWPISLARQAFCKLGLSVNSCQAMCRTVLCFKVVINCSLCSSKFVLTMLLNLPGLWAIVPLWGLQPETWFSFTLCLAQVGMAAHLLHFGLCLTFLTSFVVSASKRFNLGFSFCFGFFLMPLGSCCFCLRAFQCCWSFLEISWLPFMCLAVWFLFVAYLPFDFDFCHGSSASGHFLQLPAFDGSLWRFPAAQPQECLPVTVLGCLLKGAYLISNGKFLTNIFACPQVRYLG